MAKKASGIPSITYADAVEVALCHGWIDGQKRSLDDQRFLQRFTPRRPRSPWSKLNVEKVARLTEEGRMRPAGIAAVEAAKADGRWDAAYAPPSQQEIPPELAAAIRRTKGATAAWKGLDSRNRYAMTFRIVNAKKPETRQRLAQQFAEMLAKGERLY